MMNASDVSIDGRIVRVVVTTSHAFVAHWIREVTNNGGAVCVGLHFSLATANRVATIQLCFDHYCLIYHMYADSNPFPRSLRHFLLNPNPNNTIFGFAHDSKINIAQDQLQGGVMPYLGLGFLAAHVYKKPCLNDAGLCALGAIVLRKHIYRPPVQRWATRALSDHQVLHAATSAYFSLQIGLFLIFAMGINKPGALALQEDWGKVENIHILHENIRVTLTSSQIVILQWIAQHRQEAASYVGFDAELVVANNQPRIGTVVFCIGMQCLVIQVQRMRTLRHIAGLERFLLRDYNIFVGMDDVERKMRMFLNVLRIGDRQGVVRGLDVRTFQAAWPELREAGHHVLAMEVLGRELDAPEMVEDDWDRQFRLSDEQVETACIHALVPFGVACRFFPLA